MTIQEKHDINCYVYGEFNFDAYICILLLNNIFNVHVPQLYVKSAFEFHENIKLIDTEELNPYFNFLIFTYDKSVPDDIVIRDNIVIIDLCDDNTYRQYIIDRLHPILYYKYEYNFEKPYISIVCPLLPFSHISINHMKKKKKKYDIFIPFSKYNTSRHDLIYDIYSRYPDKRIKIGSSNYSNFIKSIHESKFVLNIGQVRGTYLNIIGMSCPDTILVSIRNLNYIGATNNCHYIKINRNNIIYDIDNLMVYNLNISKSGSKLIQEKHSMQNRMEYMVKTLNYRTGGVHGTDKKSLR